MRRESGTGLMVGRQFWSAVGVERRIEGVVFEVTSRDAVACEISSTGVVSEVPLTGGDITDTSPTVVLEFALTGVDVRVISPIVVCGLITKVFCRTERALGATDPMGTLPWGGCPTRTAVVVDAGDLDWISTTRTVLDCVGDPDAAPEVGD